MVNTQQSIVIFEGHDKSGKSTIAKELSKRFNVPYFKVQRDKYRWDPNANLDYGTEQITQFLEQTGHSVILDRFHGSDYMYNRLFKRETRDEKVFDIDERLSNLNTFIVLCYKNKDAYEDDPEDADFISIDDYTKMTDLYYQFMIDSDCRFIILNTSNQDIEEQLGEIIRQINEIV